MDPNAALLALLQDMREVHAMHEDALFYGSRLGEIIDQLEVLTAWLRKGGFLPDVDKVLEILR